MTPSIARENNRDVDVAGSATDAAAANVENHEVEEDPTVRGGNPLMWSEASLGLYINVTSSDYGSADESAEASPCSRPQSEEGFSVCSSTADLPVPEGEFHPQLQPLFVPAVVGVYDDHGELHHLQLIPQGDNILMYPPPVHNVPQGLPMPYAGAPIQMQVPHTAVPELMPAEGAIPAGGQHMVYSSPPPMMGGPQPPQHWMPPVVQSPLQQSPPHQQAAGFQTPSDVMYATPPPTVGPMGLPAHSAVEKKNVAVATMPMPRTDQEMSVGTRNGPMVLFATAPGASELTIEVPGMSGYPDSVSQQMEIVWNGEFRRNFEGLQHQWVLKPTDDTPKNKEKWKVFKDSAKNCGNAWTSMKGRVMFWMHLDEAENLGGVLFKLYGQACSKCGSDDDPTFCPAMWYPEEVVKVVGNVFNRIGQLFYGFETPGLRIDRRQGRPREHHNAKRCQACCEGVCRFEWVFSC